MKNTGIINRDYRRNITHGLRHTRQYNTWNHMMFRCYSVKDKGYKNYGARGIIVCDEWHTFEGFWKDMREGYSNELTLERIDNNGNYCKENCKWTTQQEQCRNKRTTLKVQYKGRERVLIELCSELRVRYHMVFLRLFRYKWSLRDALSKPSRINLKSQS